MLWKAPCRNRSSAEAWASKALCKGCPAATAPGRWDTGNPEHMCPAPSSVIRVTTQAGSHKNTVANIFIYRKRRVLDVFCLFLESTRFPKKTARLLSTTLRLRLNIFHTNFSPANGVVTTATKTPLFNRQSCQGQQRGSVWNRSYAWERGKPLNTSAVLFKWGGTN